MAVTTGFDDSGDRFRFPLFSVGDKVTVLNGPFECFDGTVTERDFVHALATVEINIFGRPTPVTIGFRDLKMQET